MLLDMKTIWFFSGTLLIILGFVTLLQWLNYRNIIRGIGYWGIGTIIIGIGMVLRTFPELLSLSCLVLLANTTMYIGISLNISGIAFLRKKKPLFLFNAFVIVLLISLTFYFVVIHPLLINRIIIFSIALIFFSMMGIWHLVRIGRQKARISYIIAALPFAVTGITALIRGLFALSYYKNVNYFSSGSHESIFISIFFIDHLIWISSIIFIVSSEVKLTLEKNIQERTCALDRNKLLMKEMNHRVKNNLATISSLLLLQSNQMQDNQSRMALLDSESRVRSITNIHNMLSETIDLRKTNVSRYIKDMVNDLSSSFKNEDCDIKTHLQLEDMNLDINLLIPLALILNEILTNAYKYAFQNKKEGKIGISLRSIENNSIQLIVKDNGVGLPPGFRLKDSGSLGMTIISLLVDQLNGDIKHTSEHQKGTEFKIII